ncbi:MAG: M50 family metallopeptidase [Chloroflexi bacterium]|nr:M50 family metallopeptidase [Chloroflexota bacterium]
MSIAITIVIFIGVLFFLVTCHELGHFIASKKAGVQVEEFGIGYRLGVFVSSIGEKDPTRLLALKRGGTVYSLNLLPLGAFVKTAGDDDPTVPGGLAGTGPWARLGVFAAGPIVNIFLAFLFISAYFMVPTKAVQGDGAMVHSVAEDSPAANAVMKPGDIILNIDGSDIHDWAALQDAMNSNGETEKTLLIERAGETLQIELKPAFNSDLQRYTIGVLLCWGMVTKVEEGSPAEEAGISQRILS